MLPLHERLVAYFELLLSRPDVHAHAWERGPAGRLAEADAAALPPAVAALYRCMDGLRCWWVFAAEKADVEDYRRGYNGGYLDLVPLGQGVRWTTAAPDGSWAATQFPRRVLLDARGDDGEGAYLAARAGEPAERADMWYRGEDPAFSWHALGGFERYLELGARAAFALDWPIAAGQDEPHAEAVRRRLLANSVTDLSDRAAVDAGLRARGASPAASAALIDWLGDDVALLLPR